MATVLQDEKDFVKSVVSHSFCNQMKSDLLYLKANEL